MENKVIYTVTLKDLISGALSKAEEKAKALDTSLGNLGKTAITAFGAYEAFNYIKDSVTAFDEAEQASVKLDNQLRNSGRATEEFRKALDDKAIALMKNSRFDDDAITSGQGVLAGFKNISNELLMNATPAMVDVATAMKTDVATAAQAVGMALESPADASKKLRSMNILLNDEQKKTIENMVKSGDKAGAQAMVLDLIANKYKGMGEAAAKTGMGPLIVLQNQLGNVTEKIGGVVVKILDKAMPAIEYMIGKFDDLVDTLIDVKKWVSDNMEIFEAAGYVLGGLALAVGAYVTINQIMVTWETIKYMWMMRSVIAESLLATKTTVLSAVTAAYTAVVQGLNAAWAANPIGIVVAGLVLLGTVIAYAWNNFEGFRKFVFGVFEVIKNSGEILGAYLEGLKDKIIGTLTMDDKQVALGEAKMKAAGQLVAKAWADGQTKGAANFAASQIVSNAPILDDKKNEVVVEDENKGTPVSEPKGSPTTKATTITITIDKLVESLSVNTTNIQESTSKIRELVATALTDALNDSQIIAGG